MLRNLLSLYDNSIIYPALPEKLPEQYYIFFDESGNEWIGIPKKEVTERELYLLKSLYDLIDPHTSSTSISTNWEKFLYRNGTLPNANPENYFRIIQFQISGKTFHQNELESALKGFFTDEAVIIWETMNRGIIIEERKKLTLSEKEIIALSETVESDFFMQISFYVGKFYPITEEFPSLFETEREYFHFGKKNIPHTAILSFERVFPAYLTYHLPKELIHKLNKGLSEVFNEDSDLFSTVKVFLENNLNATVTAKKLYIHRNTLQYRIDKFVEKTGIPLKDFYGAFTVFLACLIFENDIKSPS